MENLTISQPRRSELPADVESRLQEVSDDHPLSLKEAIEWLGVLGLKATPQRLRQADERYRWLEPLPTEPGKRKRYGREQLQLLVLILGLREVGLSTRQLDDFIKSLREVTSYASKAQKNELAKHDKMRLESANVRLQRRASEALKLAQQKAMVVGIVEGTCNALLGNSK